MQSDSAWRRLEHLFTPPDPWRDDLGAYRPVLTFEDGRCVSTPAQWQERRRQLLARWHGDLGAWPPLLEKPAMTALGHARSEGFTRLQVGIQVAPDRTTLAYLLIPDGRGPFPAVLDVFYTPEGGARLSPEALGQYDFGYQMARRGFVALCVGQQPGLEGSPIYYPGWHNAALQPLSYLAYVAANCCNLLASLPEVYGARIGVVGHSYGGKWAMFAGCLYERFAAVAVSDPGIVFDEARPNVNYWEPWYLGYEPGTLPRSAGVPAAANPRTGLYGRLVAEGRDLHELHALLAPRPFFVAAGSEDPPERWQALNHTVAVNRLLGFERRVGMAHRPDHTITPEASEQVCLFFEHFLGEPPATR